MTIRTLIRSLLARRNLLLLGLSSALLVACGEEPNVDPNPIVDKGVKIVGTDSLGASHSIAANFTAPSEDKDIALDGMALPLARSETAVQKALSAPSSNYYFPFYEYWKYKDLQPHPELYCDEPAGGEFAEVAKTLGGFRKTTSIFIEPDATAPRVYSGWMVNQYFWRNLAGAPESADGAGGGVTIQRPNVVGRSGSKAFYQSDIYGLITVDFANVPFVEPKVSCAQPLPGEPQNFVVTDKNLYVIVKDTASMSSGVIQFDVSGDTPSYVKGVVLKDQDVLDARLFNDTLVMYLKTYAPVQQQAVTELVAPPVSSDAIGDAVQATSILPRYSREYVYNELVVMDTLPKLEISHRESFIPEGSENPVGGDTPNDPEALYTYRNFNNFLSASGEYLLVTENVRERHFVGYETKSYNQCQEYKVTEVPYHYCYTQWKRIENPDYIPLPASGVLTCTGKLADCLKTQGPRVSRYINVPDGQQCNDGIRNQYSCLQSKTITYEMPTYRWESKTQVYAYRFNNGEFLRLDDQLATINKAQEITTTERHFVIDGLVQKHDHMQFKGNNLYIIANRDRSTNTGVDIHTLTIAGNSPVYVSQLSLSGRNYANLSAAFTDDAIYLSEGNFSSSSTLNTLSLENPLAPSVANDVKISTSLKQLFFANDGLLGVGRTTIKVDESNQTYSLGTISKFNNSGVEQNSLLLGSDYSYYSSESDYDDQIISVDQMVKRLFLPYSVSGPLLGGDLPQMQYRLTVADFSENQIREEGTLNFPQALNRTMSISQETALGFSQEFIHQLLFDETLSSRVLFDGELPDSIYYAHNSPTQIQKRIQPNSYNFRLIDSADAASGKLLDEISIPRASSNVCLSERVLFDRDRVIVVSVKPNTYIDYQDCPMAQSDIKKVFTGYRISGNKLVAISDQKEMETVWTQSNWGMVCITDTTNDEGELLNDFDLDDVDTLQCYTQTQYQSLVSDKASNQTGVVF